MSKLEQSLANILIKNHKTIAIAESCTGGLVSNRLTNLQGSSKYFKAGIVAYSNYSKIHQLKLPAEVIKQRGPINKDVAIYMAENIRKLTNADFGLGITGIAGPTGGTKSKPVGLVYIAVATRRRQSVRKFNFKGNRISIKQKSATAALRFLKECLGKTDNG
jgi:nicotinamide-nucleotide amidase